MIIVEDIVDTGLTLSYLVEHPQGKRAGDAGGLFPAVTKPSRRKTEIDITFKGFVNPRTSLW